MAEERADAAAYERDQRKIDEALDNLPRTLALLLALALGPALALVAFVWWRWGRERRSSYDREYEQEPPTETEAALVPALLAQGGTPGSLEFTATLFDLIRRGRYRAEPVTTERKIWGGLKTQQVADLELSLGRRRGTGRGLRSPRRRRSSTRSSTPGRSVSRSSGTGSRMTARGTPSASTRSSLRSAPRSLAGDWFLERRPGDPSRSRRRAALVGGLMLVWGIQSVQRRRADAGASIVKIALGVCGLVNAVALVFAAFNRGSGGGARRQRRPRPSAGKPSAAT